MLDSYMTLHISLISGELFLALFREGDVTMKERQREMHVADFEHGRRRL